MNFGIRSFDRYYSFELVARVELNDEEAGLIKKYKADKEGLLQKEIKIPFTGKSISLLISIGSLISGQTFKCGDIGEILETENSVNHEFIIRNHNNFFIFIFAYS
ncbi:MAG: hypothetical protein U9N34_02900 [Candidatus Cloacimonadota bacterium]|nr:hypothetical protein [Candidatus Cloacimonadota bacterium]